MLQPSFRNCFNKANKSNLQRFGNAITSTGTLNLRHASFANDFNTIDEDCTCICCKPEDHGGLGITRAYIYHVASKETAGAHLYVSPDSPFPGKPCGESPDTDICLLHRLTMHNVHYQLSLMERVRAAIIKDRYPAFLRDFFAKMYDGDASKAPMWAVTALRLVGVDLHA